MDPLDFITALALEAGALLAERIDRPRDVRFKSPTDLVTDADRASEALIVERIGAAFPNAAILGEEGGTYAGTSDERFIVDPLDGTTNYAHRYPIFCVSIGYEVGGVMEAGAIYAPMVGELYAARRGGGATRNGASIVVSPIDALKASLVCTGFVPDGGWERNAHNYATLSHRAQAVRRDGSAALDIAFVACGRFEAFWELDLKPWDVAAGSLIAQEAGGRVTTHDGKAFAITGGSLLVTNGHIHDAMTGLLV